MTRLASRKRPTSSSTATSNKSRRLGSAPCPRDVLVPPAEALRGTSEEDLQSWPEVPSIAHFCSLFRQAFDLLEFDIQELEESLLLGGSEDDTSQLVLRLLIRLLKGCSRTFNNISEDNYNLYLRRLFLSKREEAEEDDMAYSFECQGLLDDALDFFELSLRNRVRILHQLCEFRLDAEDVNDKVKNLDAESLRVEPLGKDSEGAVFWYFYGTRLYKELPLVKAEPSEEEMLRKHKKKRKKEKKEKKRKRKKHRHPSVSSAEEDISSRWSVACVSLEDWQQLASKYKSSKKKSDRDLHATLVESFLPEIVKMFAEKEREEKRKLLSLQPKRTSSRIERKRKEQEEKDRELAEKLEEERKIEEEYDEKLRIERVKQDEVARDERIKQRTLLKEKDAQEQAEQSIESIYSDEVQGQKEHVKKRKRGQSENSDSSEDLYQPTESKFKGKRDEDEEEYDSADSKGSSSGGDVRRKSSFANALLRVGVRSTKDSGLDTSHKPHRKTPGLLLETAGRSLLHKQQSSNASHQGSSSANTLSLVSRLGLSCGSGQQLSFGFWSGDLPVDHGANKPNKNASSFSSLETECPLPTPMHRKLSSPLKGSTSTSSSSQISKPLNTGTKRVFTNWGGEFFKKNLDFRANTNKILEKMNLASSSNRVGSISVECESSEEVGPQSDSSKCHQYNNHRDLSSLGEPSQVSGRSESSSSFRDSSAPTNSKRFGNKTSATLSSH